MIELIKPGTPVKLKNCSIEGHVIEIVITESDVLYKVSYVYDGKLEEPLLYSFQFEPLTSAKTTIGFIKTETSCCGCQQRSAD